MANLPGIVIFINDYERFKKVLTPEQKGILLDSLIDFGKSNEPYTGNDQIISVAFSFFSDAIARANEKYEKRCARNAKNIQKRWERAKEEEPTEATEHDGKKARASPKTAENQIQETDQRQDAKSERQRFTAPTVEEVREYCLEKGYRFDPEHFIDYYTARGWQLKGGVKVKDWKSCAKTWARNEREKEGKSNGGHESNVPWQREYYD